MKSYLRKPPTYFGFCLIGFWRGEGCFVLFFFFNNENGVLVFSVEFSYLDTAENTLNDGLIKLLAPGINFLVCVQNNLTSNLENCAPGFPTSFEM